MSLNGDTAICHSPQSKKRMRCALCLCGLTVPYLEIGMLPQATQRRSVMHLLWKIFFCCCCKPMKVFMIKCVFEAGLQQGTSTGNGKLKIGKKTDNFYEVSDKASISKEVLLPFFHFSRSPCSFPGPRSCFSNIPPHENARNSLNVFYLHFYDLFDKSFLKSGYRDSANS